MTWKVYLENLVNFGQLGYRMYVGKKNADGTSDFLFGPSIIHLEANHFIPQEKAFLDDSGPYRVDVRNFLQAMSDTAWEIGIKPKQIEDNSNELKATKYHLEDMRQLAGIKK